MFKSIKKNSINTPLKNEKRKRKNVEKHTVKRASVKVQEPNI
jgi:hypothetical protein